MNVDTDATEQSLDRFGHPAEQFSFAGLRKLSLLVLWGDIRAWRNQIFKIVLNSPNLEFLALSLSKDAQDEPDDEAGGAGPPDISLDLDTFQWLSRECAKATGRPLQFKSTQFHWGTKIPHVLVVEGWANPHGIDVVYIWNENNGPFLKGLETFPISDIGPQLADPNGGP